MREVVAVACVTLVGAGGGAHAQAFSLSPADQQVVERFVADDLLYPDRARFSLIRATAPTAEAVQTVCGYVEAMEPNGFRGPMRAFVGVIATNSAGQRVFANTNVAQTAFNQEVAERFCQNSGLGLDQQIQPYRPAGVSAGKPSRKIQQEMHRADTLRRRCSGSEGADPASPVCPQSADASDALEKKGWCWGRDSEPMYMAEWHRCGQ